MLLLCIVRRFHWRQSCMLKHGIQIDFYATPACCKPPARQCVWARTAQDHRIAWLNRDDRESQTLRLWSEKHPSMPILLVTENDNTFRIRQIQCICAVNVYMQESWQNVSSRNFCRDPSKLWKQYECFNSIQWSTGARDCWCTVLGLSPIHDPFLIGLF